MPSNSTKRCKPSQKASSEHKKTVPNPNKKNETEGTSKRTENEMPKQESTSCRKHNKKPISKNDTEGTCKSTQNEMPKQESTSCRLSVSERAPKMSKQMFKRCKKDPMRIFLYVYGEKGNRRKYNVRVDKPLRSVMNSYCQLMDLKRYDVRFIYDGKRIDGDQTAFELGIDYNDTIEAYTLMSGGRG